MLDLTFTGPHHRPIFMYFALRPICNPLTKKKQGMFNRFISWRIVATYINLQGDSNHRITGGFIDSRGTPTVKNQSFLEICS